MTDPSALVAELAHATEELAAAPSLVDLATRANVEHHAYEATQSAAIAHAIAAGDALLAAKRALRHGAWLPWLAEHVAFNERTARRYMKIAANRSRVADLDSVRAATAELSEPKPTRAAGAADRQRVCADAIKALKGAPRLPAREVNRLYREARRQDAAWAWRRTLAALDDLVVAGLSASPAERRDIADGLRAIADADGLRAIADKLERPEWSA